MQTVADISSLDATGFVRALGHVYEESPWVAQAAHSTAPFKSLTSLAAAMKSAVDSAGEEQQLALLRAHPDLAGKAAVAGEMTEDSKLEQKSAGLDTLTAEEHATFTRANAAYKEKYAFPFILAVRHATKATILGALTGPRLTANTRAMEMATAISQVHKIAWMRLLSAVQPVPTGYVKCQVIDTTTNCPAMGMRVTLLRHEAGGGKKQIGEWITNAEGCLGADSIIQGEAVRVGRYQWRFNAEDYFASTGAFTAGQPFLNVIAVNFGIDNPEEYYNIPLFVSPWSFSTHRERPLPLQASL